MFCHTGYPLKGSFRGKGHRTPHETHSSFTKSNHGIQHSKLRKQSTKNDLGKAKSSFEYDLDNENSFSDHDAHGFLNFYSPETGLDKMHLTPVDDNHSMRIREPHLRFDYTYDNSESEHFRHSPHRRVDSYAGEMIDDENTLSQFIAPPVFENNRNKAHEMQNEKVLYGTPEAKSAENANTKSLLESLNSLMSPLPTSGGEKNLANEFESEKGQESDSSRNGIDYGGKYHVISNLPEDERENYHDKGNQDEREFRSDERKFHDAGNYDRERWHDAGNYDRERSHDRGNFYGEGSHERGGERGNYNENRFREGGRFNDERNGEEPHQIEKYRDDRDRSDDNNFRDRHSGTENFERQRDEDHERSDHYENNGDRERHFEEDHHFDESADTYNDNHDRNADTRSSENHDEPNYNRFNYQDSNSDSPQNFEGGEENSSFRHEEPDNSEKSDNSEQNENNGNTIEMVQDDSGKLHPMSNNVSKEDITKEVQKYIGNNVPNA